MREVDAQVRLNEERTAAAAAVVANTTRNDNKAGS